MNQFAYLFNLLVFFVAFTAQAQTITEFKFTAAATGWNEDLMGTIDQEKLTITFTTQKWIENIALLPSTFKLDGNYQVTVGGTLQTSGITTNDFRKDVVYTINGNVHYTVSFVSPMTSGLPVINIHTENGTEITSKVDYTNMTFALTDPNDPANVISKTNMKDQIRGRGNDSWNNVHAKKKSYRIKFDKKTALFGLEAAKSWVLIAQYRDPTLLFNVTAFELGNRFALPFNHSFNFVDLYLNGEYKGNYLLTEQNQVNPGRVDINATEGWLVEMDNYYDEDPKFKTRKLTLPVMIKSPEFEPAVINNSAYAFVRIELNTLTDSVASAHFPENGYRNLLNMDTFIDFLMINEICDNKEIETPMSTYMYKDKDNPINMGPLWDFDSSYGYAYGTYTHYHKPDARTPVHPFFKRLFDDPLFLVKYMERWNEKYDDIVSIPNFMDETARKIEKSATQNFQTWWYRTFAEWTKNHPFEQNDFPASVSKLKDYYNARIAYLHNELNKVAIFPASKDFGTETSVQAFTLVTYGTPDELKTKFGNGDLSGFELAEPAQSQATGKGGYFTFIRVKPKKNLPIGLYNDVLTLSGKNQGKAFSMEISLSYKENNEPEEPTGFDDIPPANLLKAWTRNKQLHLSGLTVGETLSVYTATGALVYKNIATSGEADIPLKSRGVYIVQSGSNTVKVTFD